MAALETVDGTTVTAAVVEPLRLGTEATCGEGVVPIPNCGTSGLDTQVETVGSTETAYVTTGSFLTKVILNGVGEAVARLVEVTKTADAVEVEIEPSILVRLEMSDASDEPVAPATTPSTWVPVATSPLMDVPTPISTWAVVLAPVVTVPPIGFPTVPTIVPLVVVAVLTVAVIEDPLTDAVIPSRETAAFPVLVVAVAVTEAIIGVPCSALKVSVEAVNEFAAAEATLGLTTRPTEGARSAAPTEDGLAVSAAVAVVAGDRGAAEASSTAPCELAVPLVVGWVV